VALTGKNRVEAQFRAWDGLEPEGRYRLAKESRTQKTRKKSGKSQEVKETKQRRVK
jgi:hypothetical protein